MKTIQSSILNPINLIPLGLVSLSLLSSIILASSTVSAEDPSVVDQINITVPVSCTMSGTGMTSHNAEINNGQYNSAIGETILKAFCNDNEGFAIYAIGYTDNEEGKNVLTSSTLGSTYDISTGTATSGTDSNWAMKLSTITSPTPTYPIIIAGTSDDTLKAQGDPDYSTFQEVPDDYTKVAYRTSNTDTGTSAEGSTLKTTYQAYISPTQSAGTYTGQVKYTLVHPHTATKPERRIYMQNLDSSLCTSTPMTVYDNRDNHSYMVKRLNDGNCWMIDNLDLGRNTLATDLTSANTNLSATITASSFNSWKDTTGSATNDTGVFVSVDGSDSVSGTAYGTLYNYYAVSAGTIYGSSNSNDASYDICPAGWRLPTGGDSGEIQSLIAAYYNSAGYMHSSAANGGPAFAFSGYFYNSTPIRQGESSLYWSSTRIGDVMYSMTINSSSVNQSPTLRGHGGSIRCLLK